MKKSDILDPLVRHLVGCADYSADRIDEILDPAGEHGLYTHDNYGCAAHIYLSLYVTNHPENSYYSDKKALDAYKKLVGGWVKKFQQAAEEGEYYRYPEWPILIMCRGIELLGDKLGEDLRWGLEQIILKFVENDISRPFFFTAPNHEVVKLLDVALAGRLFNRPEWREQAAFEAEQLIAMQTPEGFWEEGRHHGPSMGYNYTMLTGLAPLARELDDEKILSAAGRLAAFTVRWVYPDGLTVGPFDGRKPTAPGGVAPGMDLVPEGLAHLVNTMRFWQARGWLDADSAEGKMFRSRHSSDWAAAEALLYYADLPDTPSSAEAGLTAAGQSLENHTPYFDGTLMRKGPWIVALSSQMSDVPKDTQYIYRLERQNRIEIWHEKASVVLGGGHNLITADYPLYNVFVEPGYHHIPTAYSNMGDKAGSPEMARRRSKYYARAAGSGMGVGFSWLELFYAHARIRFEVEPSADAVSIRCRYRVVGVKELRLAVPLLFWAGAQGKVDGNAFFVEEKLSNLTVKNTVTVKNPLFGTETKLTVPGQGHTHLLFPLESAGFYRPVALKSDSAGYFVLGFVETVFEAPEKTGSSVWTLSVDES